MRHAGTQDIETPRLLLRRLLPEDAPQFVKDYYAYYKTPRGYHPRSLNSNNGWNVNSIIDQEYLKGRERFYDILKAVAKKYSE